MGSSSIAVREQIGQGERGGGRVAAISQFTKNSQNIISIGRQARKVTGRNRSTTTTFKHLETKGSSVSNIDKFSVNARVEGIPDCKEGVTRATEGVSIGTAQIERSRNRKRGSRDIKRYGIGASIMRRSHINSE